MVGSSVASSEDDLALTIADSNETCSCICYALDSNFCFFQKLGLSFYQSSE